MKKYVIGLILIGLVAYQEVDFKQLPKILSLPKNFQKANLPKTIHVFGDSNSHREGYVSQLEVVFNAKIVLHAQPNRKFRDFIDSTDVPKDVYCVVFLGTNSPKDTSSCSIFIEKLAKNTKNIIIVVPFSKSTAYDNLRKHLNFLAKKSALETLRLFPEKTDLADQYHLSIKGQQKLANAITHQIIFKATTHE